MLRKRDVQQLGAFSAGRLPKPAALVPDAGGGGHASPAVGSARTAGHKLLPLADLSLKQLTQDLAPPDVAARLTLKGDAPLDGAQDSGPFDPSGHECFAQPSRPPRRRRAGLPDPPRRSDGVVGWNELVAEVAASSRRIRVARGGHLGASVKRRADVAAPKTACTADESAGLASRKKASAVVRESLCVDRRESRLRDTSPVAAARDAAAISSTQDLPAGGSEDAAEVAHGAAGDEALAGENVWPSYRIDGNRVPNSVLAKMWRRAVDPKHFRDEVEPIKTVPRLTVTNREVEQLPVVHDVEHWRQLNAKRRKQRKSQEETEKNPPLKTMLRTIFGETAPPQMFFDALQKRADSETMREPTDAEVHEEVCRELLADFFREASPRAFDGVAQRGRRGAFDNGRVQDGATPLDELIGYKTARQRRKAIIVKRWEAVLESEGTGEDNEMQKLEALSKATARVNDVCTRKVRRMHALFLRKKGQLSQRLQTQIQRLRTDFEEIHEIKVGTILPSAVRGTGQPWAPATDASRDPPTGKSVLSFLKRHRRLAERERQVHHAWYLQQVEMFHFYLRLLADPIRPPNRGELYLSGCFKHVLAGGLLVDNDFFLRALSHMEKEDFEQVFTVNMLAACCDAFGVSTNLYKAFLHSRGFPFYAPRRGHERAPAWEGVAAWEGVRLELVPDEGVPAAEAAAVSRAPIRISSDAEETPRPDDACALPTLDVDPFVFCPILPAEIPSASEIISKDEPLFEILRHITMDSVLDRYAMAAKLVAAEEQDSRRGNEEDGENDIGSFRAARKTQGRPIAAVAEKDDPE